MSNAHIIASYAVAAADGDHLGLHELIAAIGRRAPELAPDEIRRICRDTCRDLIERACVRLVSTPAFADRPGRDGYVDVPDDDAREILSDDTSWQSPSEAQTRYWLVATDVGRSEYISDGDLSL